MLVMMRLLKENEAERRGYSWEGRRQRRPLRRDIWAELPGVEEDAGFQKGQKPGAGDWLACWSDRKSSGEAGAERGDVVGEAVVLSRLAACAWSA